MAVDIITKIDLDLKSPNAEKVYANQYDNTGHVVAQLLNSGEKWFVPNGAIGLVQYQKSDRIGGYYDTTDPGETAVAVESDRSIISIALDGQLMTTSGNVYVEVSFYQNNKRLSTFAFLLEVKPCAIMRSNIESKWFINVLRLSGLTVDDTLTTSGEAADAKVTGDKIEEEKTRALDAESVLRTQISNEVSRAANSEALKVNKPVESPNGRAGQLLRSNGDGTTDWVDEGAPTDTQVETAVTNWLDEHPEATTTVEDDSLTPNKLIPDLKKKVTRTNIFSNRIFKRLHLEDILPTEILDVARGVQSAAYNSTTNRIAITLATDDTNYIDYIIEFDIEWNYIRHAGIEMGHANDITYNRRTNKYYVAHGTDRAAIVVIDADSLEYDETIQIVPALGPYTQISYDDLNDCYYVRESENNIKLYKVSSDFQEKELLIDDFFTKSSANDYNATTIYSQGSCCLNGRFISSHFFGNNLYSYSRLVFLNEDNTEIDFFYDYQNTYRYDETEGVFIVGDIIYVVSVTSSGYDLIIRKIYLNDYCETSEPHFLKAIIYNSTDKANVFENIHRDAYDYSIYEYAVSFSVEHPELGGVNGFIRGFRSQILYGYQEFSSPETTATRKLWNGVWGKWFVIRQNQNVLYGRNSSAIDASLIYDSGVSKKQSDVNAIVANCTPVATLAELLLRQRFVRSTVGIPLGSTGVTLEAYARGVVIGNGSDGKITGCLLAVGYSGKIYSAFIDNGAIANAKVFE